MKKVLILSMFAFATLTTITAKAQVEVSQEVAVAQEEQVLIQSMNNEGTAGTAIVVSTGEVIDVVNPGRIEVEAGVTIAIANIMRITRGNPPKEQIIGVLMPIRR